MPKLVLENELPDNEPLKHETYEIWPAIRAISWPAHRGKSSYGK